MLKDLFLSYGRRESLGLVARLHQHLKLLGYEVWFDKVNIPDGEDYAARINHGIESAHNFVYVLAPRALFSPYCLIELEYARLLGKRIIPLNQQVVFQAPEQWLSEGDKHALRAFYAAQNIAPPRLETVQDVLERSLALIGKTDWLDAKTLLNDTDCVQMATWAQSYENQWHKHEELAYLQTLELPTFGTAVDSFSSVLERLQLVLERHKSYVAQHTVLTYQALEWNRQQRANHHLLVAKERQAAEEWLLTVFKEGEQAPCQPSDLLCEFISEARKNAENRMTDCFICYDVADKAMRNVIVKALARHVITTWRHDSDIQHGGNAEQAILMGIASADNILYFLSPNSLESVACQQELAYAKQLNKRIIPLLIAETTLPPQDLQYIRCLDNTSQGIHELLHILHSDAFYYEQHKILLVRAIHWKAQDAKSSFLLRGYQLENAKTWLRLNAHREQYAPTTLHSELITASEAAKERLGTEVFLSYSRKDGDFARRLNRALQEAGKTVWFDQESISSGVNFEAEIYKGIQHSDNFLFLISPDAVDSPYCENEVNYAMQQGKRIFTVLCRETDVARLPETLKTLQWLDFSRAEAFDAQFPELVQTLELDREHAHQHTVLQQRANEWLDNAKSRDFLLNLSACQKAETWLAATDTKQPHPTRLQGEYIQASRTAIEQIRRKEQRRQRIILGSVLLGMLIAIVLASFAWERSIEAEKQTQLATAQKAEAEKQKAEAWHEKAIAQENYKKAQINNAKGLAHRAETLMKDGDYTRALRVAQLAYETNPEPQIPILEVEQVLSDAYNNVTVDDKKRFYQHAFSLDTVDDYTPHIKKGYILTADKSGGYLRNERGEVLRYFEYDRNMSVYNVSPEGDLIATDGENNTLNVWDALGQLHRLPTSTQCSTLVKLSCEVSKIIFPSENTLLSIHGAYEYQMHRSYFEFSLWNIQQNKLLKTQTARTQEVNILFSDNNQYMAVIIPQTKQWLVQVWKTNELTLLYTSHYPEQLVKTQGFSITALSNDGKKLIITDSENQQFFSLLSLEDHKHLKLSHDNEVITSLKIAPNNNSFASGGAKGEIIIWDFRGNIKQKWRSHTDTINSLEYSKNGQFLLSASSDKSVRLSKLDSESVAIFPHSQIVNVAYFSNDGEHIVTVVVDILANKFYYKTWSIQSQKNSAYSEKLQFINTINKEEKVVLVSATEDETKLYLHLFSRTQSRLELLQSWIPLLVNTHPSLDFRVIPTPTEQPNLSFVGIHKKREWLIAIGSDGFFRVYDLYGHLVAEWISTFCTNISEDNNSCNLAISKTGDLIVESDGQTVVVWDIYGKKVKQFTLPFLLNTNYNGYKYNIDITPDNHHLIFYKNSLVHIFDVNTTQLLRSIHTGVIENAIPTVHELIVSETQFDTQVMKAIPLFENSNPFKNIVKMQADSLKTASVSGETVVVTSNSGTQLNVWKRDSAKPSRILKSNRFVHEAILTQDEDILVTVRAYSNGGTLLYLWPSTKHIYEWAKNSKDIYQLTAEDKEELGIEE